MLNYFLYAENGTELAYEWNTINQNVTYSATTAEYNIIIEDVSPAESDSSSSTSETMSNTSDKETSSPNDNSQNTPFDNFYVLMAFISIPLLFKRLINR